MRNSGRPVTPPTTGGVLVDAPDADRPLEDERWLGLDEPVEAALRVSPLGWCNSGT